MRMRIVLCLLLLLALQAFAAEDPGKQALAKAHRIADPEHRLEALRAVAKNYPKSSAAERANDHILDLLVHQFPSRSGEIRKQIRILLRSAKGSERAREMGEVADTLAEGRVLLPDAKKYAEKSLSLLTEKEFVAYERKALAEAKMKIPDDTSLHHDYLTVRSPIESALGRILIELGNMEQARSYLESALADYPDNSEAAAAFGELDAKEGRHEQALAHLTRARLTGKLDPAQEKLLETEYAKLRPQSASLDAYLDESYVTLFPETFKPAKYTSEVSRRTVLVELFTGSGCQPCAGADVATDAALLRYSRHQLAVLEFDQHQPEPDPLTCPEGVKRFAFYEAAFAHLRG